MSEQSFFNGLLIGWFALASVIFVVLLYINAPYGRHSRSGWGLSTSARLGWVVMEAAAPLVFAACFMLGSNITITSVVFLAMWEYHYVHRAFIYPFSLQDSAKRMPWAVITMGLVFNGANAYLNGRYLFSFSGGYNNAWLGDPRFAVGLGLFIAGYIVNRRADSILRGLRKRGESGYRVANSELYHWISCPNYLGEIVTWVGWAIATWSLAGLAFAVWTAANLVPRARAHHIWYREQFPDYPAGRKALVPGLW